MPRIYQLKKPPAKLWKAEDLKAAVEAVWSKRLTISTAARQFGIPRTTSADHVHKRRAKLGAGGPTILTPQGEKEPVVTCQVLQSMGFRVTREIVGMVVQDYLHDHPERGRYFDGNGFDWWQCFLCRWSDLKKGGT